ncbi:MAG: hypothetical protein AB7F25_04215 [Deferribacterales bacterium]
MKNLFYVLFFCFLVSSSVYAQSFVFDGNKLDVYAQLRTYAMFENVQGSDSYRDIAQTVLGTQYDSRVGALWSKDNLTARLELGFPYTVSSNDSIAKMRYFYVTMQLPNDYGELTVGQFDSIAANPHFGRVLNIDNALGGIGNIANIRRPGVAYKTGGFAFQLTSLSVDSSNYTGLFSDYSDVRYKMEIPKAEISYTFKTFPLQVFSAGTVFAADGTNSDDNEESFSTPAYHFGFNYEPNLGKFHAVVAGFYAVNSGLMGMVKTGNGKGDVTNLLPVLESNGDVYDVKTLGGAVSVIYDFTPKVSMEVAAGYQTSTSDADSWTHDDNNVGGYINFPLKIMDHVTLIPEIGYYDYLKTSTGANDATDLQVGLQFRFAI